jgi:hypothetical protein
MCVAVQNSKQMGHTNSSSRNFLRYSRTAVNVNMDMLVYCSVTMETIELCVGWPAGTFTNCD